MSLLATITQPVRQCLVPEVTINLELKIESSSRKLREGRCYACVPHGILKVKPVAHVGTVLPYHTAPLSNQRAQAPYVALSPHSSPKNDTVRGGGVEGGRLTAPGMVGMS